MLDAQAGTALCAAGFKDALPPGGFHAGAEAVGALALKFAGLIRALHVRGCALVFSPTWPFKGRQSTAFKLVLST
mgnify:CR=1 FL=1